MARLIVPAICLALFAGSCGESEAEREAAAMEHAVPDRSRADGALVLSQGEQASLGLVVEPVGEAVLPEVHERFGRVRARPGDEAVVVSPVAARVVSITTLSIGSPVGEDTVVVSVSPVLGTGESLTLASGSAELRGQIEAAGRELALGESTLTRARELSRTTVVSVQAVEEAEANVGTTRARLAALRNAVALRGRAGHGALDLLAPRAGALVALEVTVGTVVSPGEVLARVLADGPRLVDIEVPAGEPVGTAFEIALAEGTLPGALVARGAVATGVMRTDRIEVPGGADVLPGGIVRVRVAGEPRTGPVVPETALVPTADGQAVYVELEPGVFSPREVVVAARLGGRVRLSRGVSIGERVVVAGAMGLRGETLRGELGHTE